eukprot:scaffold2385_cov81-Skeletonema_marinoi.AAC.1
MFRCSFDPLVFLLLGTYEIISSVGVTSTDSLFRMEQFRAAKHSSCHHLGYEDPTNMLKLKGFYIAQFKGNQDLSLPTLTVVDTVCWPCGTDRAAQIGIGLHQGLAKAAV